VISSGLPKSKLGVNHIRARIVAFCGQCKLAGVRTPSPTAGDLVMRRKEKGGASVHLSETQMNREEDSLMVFRIVGVLYAILPAWARTRACSPGDGPDWVRLSLVLFLLFPFLFLPGLRNL
jgi:hypothetical protein